MSNLSVNPAFWVRRSGAGDGLAANPQFASTSHFPARSGDAGQLTVPANGHPRQRLSLDATSGPKHRVSLDALLCHSGGAPAGYGPAPEMFMPREPRAPRSRRASYDEHTPMMGMGMSAAGPMQPSSGRRRSRHRRYSIAIGENAAMIDTFNQQVASHPRALVQGALTGSRASSHAGSYSHSSRPQMPTVDRGMFCVFEEGSGDIAGLYDIPEQKSWEACSFEAGAAAAMQQQQQQQQALLGVAVQDSSSIRARQQQQQLLLQAPHTAAGFMGLNGMDHLTAIKQQQPHTISAEAAAAAGANLFPVASLVPTESLKRSNSNGSAYQQHLRLASAQAAPARAATPAGMAEPAPLNSRPGTAEAWQQQQQMWRQQSLQRQQEAQVMLLQPHEGDDDFDDDDDIQVLLPSGSLTQKQQDQWLRQSPPPPLHHNASPSPDPIMQQQQQPLVHQRSRPVTASEVLQVEQPCAAAEEPKQQPMESRKGLTSLQVIELEVQRLLQIQDWLASAQALAAPGSKAAAACEAAAAAHQSVLEQALAAREALQEVLLEHIEVKYRRHSMMPAYGRLTFEELDGYCKDVEDLLPVKSESLHYFGHYGVI